MNLKQGLWFDSEASQEVWKKTFYSSYTTPPPLHLISDSIVLTMLRNHDYDAVRPKVCGHPIVVPVWFLFRLLVAVVLCSAQPLEHYWGRARRPWERPLALYTGALMLEQVWDNYFFLVKGNCNSKTLYTIVWDGYTRSGSERIMAQLQWESDLALNLHNTS